MKILTAQPGPFFSVQDVHKGWAEALEKCGNQIAEFNLGERLTMYDGVYVNPDGKGESYVKAFSTETAKKLAVNGLYATLFKLRPDVLFVTYPYFYDPFECFDLIRANGTKVVFNHTESPYDDEHQLKMAHHADINLINDPTNIDKFREIGPTYYMPQSYRQGFHCPGPAIDTLKNDISFVGTGYPTRINFFEAMDFEGIDFFLAGNWPMLGTDSKLLPFIATDEVYDCLENEQTLDVYRSSRMSINVYRKEKDMKTFITDAWSCGPREMEMAATGLFFLREPRGEGDELFPMLPTFSSPEEATELMRWWLAHDDTREEMASLARERVADRNFDNRAVELMQLLEK